MSLALPPRLECLREFLSDEVITAASRRLILGEALPKSFDRGQCKAALLLVRELNPDEVIEQGEETILRGIRKDDTLRQYKTEGHFPKYINGQIVTSQRR